MPTIGTFGTRRERSMGWSVQVSDVGLLRYEYRWPIVIGEAPGVRAAGVDLGHKEGCGVRSDKPRETGIAVRAFSTVIAVVIAVAVSANLGDTATGKLVAAVLIALTIAVIEWSLIWLPDHSAYVRQKLDPRAQHGGMWLQDVKKTFDASGNEVDDSTNRFAIYWIDFVGGDYRVVGFAYGANGKRWARWESVDSPTFRADKKMIYRFKGTIAGEVDPGARPERRGVTELDLESRTGQVDHVGVGRIIIFDIRQIDQAFLDDRGCGDLSPDDLKRHEPRDRMAEAIARRLRADERV